MRLTHATLQLTRPDSSLLTFLSVLLPLLARGRDFDDSLRRALPLLFVSICTFIINDLDDIEKDKINHPERPLPSGQVKPAYAAALYYVCLASALLTTRYSVTETRIAFWYYLLLALSISYSQIVEFLPGFKAVYVSGVVSIPVLIIIAYYPKETGLYGIAAAVGAFTLGRELCMDLRDRLGDPVSFLHRIAPRRVAAAAFGIQGAGLIIVSWRIGRLLDLLVLLIMVLLFVLSHLCWFRLRRLKTATGLMKAVILLGLYFLL